MGGVTTRDLYRSDEIFARFGYGIKTVSNQTEPNAVFPRIYPRFNFFAATVLGIFLAAIYGKFLSVQIAYAFSGYCSENFSVRPVKYTSAVRRGKFALERLAREFDAEVFKFRHNKSPFVCWFCDRCALRRGMHDLCAALRRGVNF